MISQYFLLEIMVIAILVSEEHILITLALEGFAIILILIGYAMEQHRKPVKVEREEPVRREFHIFNLAEGTEVHR